MRIMFRTWRILSVAALAVTSFALVPACNKSSDSGKPLVAFISNNPEEFWTICQKGTEKAAAEFGVQVEFRRPPNSAADQQRRIIEDLQSKGVKAIAISPNDSANKIAFFKEINERLPLIAVDNDIPDVGARRCYLGTDNVSAGRSVGRLVKETIPQGGKLMIFVGNLDSQNAQERRHGVVTELAGGEDKCQEQLKALDKNKYPITFGKYELLGTMTDNGQRATCRQKADDTLSKHPDVNCLVGLWAYNPPAILEALKSAGKEGKIAVIAFDEDEQTLGGIKDGTVAGTIVQDPYNFGYESVKILASYAKGTGDADLAARKDMNKDKQIYIRHRIINKSGKPGALTGDEKIEQVDAFHEKLKDLKK
jgi:ribose transport system substrate-binding protein